MGCFCIEIFMVMGFVLIGEGSFFWEVFEFFFGIYVESLWIVLESDFSVLMIMEVIGGSFLDIVNV